MQVVDVDTARWRCEKPINELQIKIEKKRFYQQKNPVFYLGEFPSSEESDYYAQFDVVQI